MYTSVPGKMPIIVAAAYVGHLIDVSPDPKFSALKGTAGIRRRVRSPLNPWFSVARSSASRRSPASRSIPPRPRKRATPNAMLAPTFAPIVV